ncbi:MAG: hypothetical protein WBC47_00470, partial [Dehalococcoidia bacterium]
VPHRGLFWNRRDGSMTSGRSGLLGKTHYHVVHPDADSITDASAVQTLANGSTAGCPGEAQSHSRWLPGRCMSLP